MQTLIITNADYPVIAKKARSNYESEMQIELQKGGCTLYVVLSHEERFHTEIGASHGGISEMIGVCDMDKYSVIEVECQDENSETIPHNFDASKLLKLLN